MQASIFFEFFGQVRFRKLESTPRRESRGEWDMRLKLCVYTILYYKGEDHEKSIAKCSLQFLVYTSDSLLYLLDQLSSDSLDFGLLLRNRFFMRSMALVQRSENCRILIWVQFSVNRIESRVDDVLDGFIEEERKGGNESET